MNTERAYTSAYIRSRSLALWHIHGNTIREAYAKHPLRGWTFKHAQGNIYRSYLLPASDLPIAKWLSSYNGVGCIPQQLQSGGLYDHGGIILLTGIGLHTLYGTKESRKESCYVVIC
jgi:hypothetical protein